ncbi:4Fe-4S binding protein [Candidatus Woesearchaeota archaeon]|nr:4Fe-4S binding protein [Candidatus Woesearchaeota archaeon]
MKKGKKEEKEKKAEEEKKRKKTDITKLRRIVQIIAFILFIYGGLFITAQHVDSVIMPFVKPPTRGVKQSHLEPQTEYDEVFDTYFPTRTCRYIGTDTRLYRACAMHFLTEVPIYGVPLIDFLPHLFFFLILAFLLSRFMCGWLCPLGSIQDFLNWVRKKLRLNYLKLPRFFLNIFEKFRYIWLVFLFVMAIAIVIPALGLVHLERDLNIITCNTCPGRIFFPILTGDMPSWWVFHNPINTTLSILGIVFFIIFLLSFFGKRLWCKICPTGALLSLFNKGGAITKVKDVEKCTKCGICERVCPMDNKKVFQEKNKKIVNSYNCINCFRCIDKCPEDNTLKVKFFKWDIFKSKYKDKKKKL